MSVVDLAVYTGYDTRRLDAFREDDMIGPGTTIRGSVTAEEDLNIEGQIEGSIRTTKDITVAASATVSATVDAETVDINGRVSGDITAATAVKVASGATLVGDIATPRVHIADGAHFTGRIDMDFEIPAIK